MPVISLLLLKSLFTDVLVLIGASPERGFSAHPARLAQRAMRDQVPLQQNVGTGPACHRRDSPEMDRRNHPSACISLTDKTMHVLYCAGSNEHVVCP